MKNEQKKIVKKEVRFAYHIPKTDNNEDYHYVKSQITYDDGSTAPRTELLLDQTRPIGVTQESRRNYIEKKEFEHMDNLVIKQCTQSDVNMTVADMLGENWLAKFPHKIKDSPYVFGYDITAANCIKLESLIRNDFIQSPYKVLAFDLEAVPGTNELLCGSNVMRNDKGGFDVHCTIDAKWVSKFDDIKLRVTKAMANLMPEYMDNLNIVMNVHEDPVDMVRDLFKVANEWAPDFMSIWNMDYDINQAILPLLERRNISPKDILCDQRVPRDLRRFTYKQGKNMKVTASKKESPIHPADQWHRCDGTMTFQIIDSMCTHRILRVHQGRAPSYSLEYTTQKFLKHGKLVVPGTEGMNGLEWHLYMQEHKIAEYIVYNIKDNILQLLLDEVTGDLSSSLPSFSEIVPFSEFGSSDRKNYCSLYVYGLSKNLMVGTSCDIERLYGRYGQDESLETRSVYKHRVMSLKDWIQTLPQGNFVRNGLKIFEDFPELITNARGNAVDLDSVSSYPSCIMAGNVSKKTCNTEIVSISGIDVHNTKLLLLGGIVGNSNALEFCEVMFELPSLHEIARMCDENEI